MADQHFRLRDLSLDRFMPITCSFAIHTPVLSPLAIVYTKLRVVFLVGASNNKRARLLQSLVFSLLEQARSDETFVQFVQLNEYVGNTSKL